MKKYLFSTGLLTIAKIVFAAKYWQCSICPKDHYCPDESASPISCATIGPYHMTDSAGATASDDCKSPLAITFADMAIGDIDLGGSIAGNAGGVPAGASGGWYLSATAQSTTINIRRRDGTIYSKNLGPLAAGQDYKLNTGDGTNIGGFHTMCCDTLGLPSSHPYHGYARGQIMPSSVWTKAHQPQDANGGYAYLANYSGSAKPWVMVYPASYIGGKAVSRPILNSKVLATGAHGGYMAPLRYISYDTMRSYLAAVGARPLHNGGYFTKKDETTPYSGQNGYIYAHSTCYDASYSTAGNRIYAAVSDSRLASEYCASRQGTPDAGDPPNDTCGNNADEPCGYGGAWRLAGGYVRNGMSMISKIGLWAGTGYLYEDINASASQQAFNKMYRLVAGGDSVPSSSGQAVPGFVDSNSLKTATHPHYGVRGASVDIGR